MSNANTNTDPAQARLIEVYNQKLNEVEQLLKETDSIQITYRILFNRDIEEGESHGEDIYIDAAPVQNGTQPEGSNLKGGAKILFDALEDDIPKTAYEFVPYFNAALPGANYIANRVFYAKIFTLLARGLKEVKKESFKLKNGKTKFYLGRASWFVDGKLKPEYRARIAEKDKEVEI